MSQETNLAVETAPNRYLQEAVTLKSLVVGIFVVLLSEAYITWGMMHLASRMNKSYLPMGLFFVYVVVVLVNLGFDRAKSRWALSQPELQVVLAMGLVGAFFPFFGLASFLPTVIAAPFYLDTPENGWRELLHEHMPTWIVLHNEDGAATLFYEGLAPHQPIPWEAWIVPTFWWGTLVCAIGWATLCIMVILRKQWVENERLEYPLMNVSIKMAGQSDDPEGLAHMVKQRGFKVGCVLGAIAVLWNIVTFFYPLIPRLPTTPNAATWLRWMDGAPTFWVQISIYIIGFAYFARVEALLSFWVFFFLTGIEVSVFDRLGVGSSVGQGGLEAVRMQSFGAFVMIVLVSLWLSREHLKAVFRKAFKDDPEVDDSHEALSYRTAVFGLAIGLLYIGGWFHLAGMEFKVLVLYMFFALVAYIGLSRIVAEMGLPYANISDTALNYAPIYILGSRAITAPSMVSQGFIYALFATTRGFLGPPLAQTLKLTSRLKYKRSRLISAIVIAVALGFCGSMVDTIYTSYRQGGYNLGGLTRVTGVRNN
ncbi:MAG: hypothetical protein QGG64_05215, partial [Candidatus Latescibacteria bacterium]|nr:hypothetical protein [Candidatus Latescibacterota bacterium]